LLFAGAAAGTMKNPRKHKEKFQERNFPRSPNGSVQNLIETINVQDSLGPLQQGLLVGLLDTSPHCFG